MLIDFSIRRSLTDPDSERSNFLAEDAVSIVTGEWLALSVALHSYIVRGSETCLRGNHTIVRCSR